MQKNQRYERKYLIEGQSASQVVALLKQHPAGFREIYPDRVVNSIYFDTLSWKYYIENVAGASERQKVRLRWYGKTRTPSNIVLERKMKQEFLVSKDVHQLEKCSLHDTGKITYSASEKAPLLLGAYPVIANRYRRAYWLSRDNQIRATVDSHVTFWSVTQNRVAWQQPRHTTATILELKYSPESDNEIAQITRSFPFRMTKSSKYVIGVEKIYGRMPRILSET